MKKLFLLVAIALAFVACKTEASDASPTMWKVTVNPNGATGLTQLEYEVKDGDTLAALSNTPALPAQYVVLAGYQDDLKAEFILGQTAVKRNMTIKMLWKTDPNTPCTGVDYTDTNYFNATYNGTVLTLACAKLADEDMERKDGSGATALITAAKGGALESVKYLHVIGVDFKNRDNATRDALSWAAYYARLDVIKYLVEQAGVDINTKDNSNYTALMQAASGNSEPNNGDRLKTLQYFINYPNIDLTSRVSNNVIPSIFDKTALGIVEVYLSNNPNNTVFQATEKYLKPIYEAKGIAP